MPSGVAFAYSRTHIHTYPDTHTCTHAHTHICTEEEEDEEVEERLTGEDFRFVLMTYMFIMSP